MHAHNSLSQNQIEAFHVSLKDDAEFLEFPINGKAPFYANAKTIYSEMGPSITTLQ